MSDLEQEVVEMDDDRKDEIARDSELDMTDENIEK